MYLVAMLVCACVHIRHLLKCSYKEASDSITCGNNGRIRGCKRLLARQLSLINALGFFPQAIGGAEAFSLHYFAEPFQVELLTTGIFSTIVAATRYCSIAVPPAEKNSTSHLLKTLQYDSVESS